MYTEIVNESQEISCYLYINSEDHDSPYHISAKGEFTNKSEPKSS